ncbi:MAG: hypothetical protein J7L11_01595 [Thermoprotei archaeon]|nr:hypothetical protein [Thermoprotei archaeon]
MLFNNKRLLGYNWSGLIPPQYILAKRHFKKIVLNPPEEAPGSWRGAGKVLVDMDSGEFWLTTRPRKAHPVRGYAVELYKSKNGEDFTLVASLGKEEISSLSGLKVLSIEGQQLLRDPTTGKYHLYLAVDNESPPLSGWDTLLLVSDDPAGPWEAYGLVIRRDMYYDMFEARDATIDIVDGMYMALYKANDGTKVNMALAISSDGIRWRKLGVLKLNGLPQPRFFLLCGKILAGSLGPVFMGFENLAVVRGAAVTNTFSAYVIDHRGLNLELIFRGEWKPLSPYERQDYPIHSYIDIAYDPFKERLLLYVEAIDPRDIGLNQEIDRVLLYEVPLGES